jgi:hypothetical protein
MSFKIFCRSLLTSGTGQLGRPPDAPFPGWRGRGCVIGANGRLYASAQKTHRWRSVNDIRPTPEAFDEFPQARHPDATDATALIHGSGLIIAWLRFRVQGDRVAATLGARLLRRRRAQEAGADAGLGKGRGRAYKKEGISTLCINKERSQPHGTSTPRRKTRHDDSAA